MRVVATLCLLIATARAQVAPDSAAATPAIKTAQLWVGPTVELVPSGSLSWVYGTDLGLAYALGGVIEMRVTRYVTLGVAPRAVVPVTSASYSHGVSQPGSRISGSQLDLRMRITAGSEIASGWRLYAVETLGYSEMFGVYPTNLATPVMYQTTSGLVAGFGLGASFAIGPRLLCAAEFTYQLGFQQGTFLNRSEALSDNLLTIGIGLLFGAR